MSNISKRRKEGSRAKIKSMGDHKEFLKRITKTLYYGQLPSLPCLSLPVTEISCSVWSESQRSRSVRRLHADTAARMSRRTRTSPASLVLALLYMERLATRTTARDYLANTAPADLFLITLMVGNKFLQDDGEDEEVLCSEWASSGGLDTSQVKRLELEFLNAIDWNVFVNEESFEKGLQWLEREVALKQAKSRGFFTYTDLVAASEGAAFTAALVEAAEASIVAAASCMASLLALVTSALLVSATYSAHSALLLAAISSTTSALQAFIPPTDNMVAHTFPPPLTPTQYIPNSTVELSLDLEPPAATDRPTCCSKWTRYRQQTAPKLHSYDSIVTTDWKWIEPWWSKTILNWLYQSSPDNPMQRWLERINEYIDLLKRDFYMEKLDKCRYYDSGLPYSDQQKCVRQWLNLSKLSALVVSVSDR